MTPPVCPKCLLGHMAYIPSPLGGKVYECDNEACGAIYTRREIVILLRQQRENRSQTGAEKMTHNRRAIPEDRQVVRGDLVQIATFKHHGGIHDQDDRPCGGEGRVFQATDSFNAFMNLNRAGWCEECNAMTGTTWEGLGDPIKADAPPRYRRKPVKSLDPKKIRTKSAAAKAFMRKE